MLPYIKKLNESRIEDGAAMVDKTPSMREMFTMMIKNRPSYTLTFPAKTRQFVLTNEEVITLANWFMLIENPFKRPMDIEWAKDGITGDLFIIQSSRRRSCHKEEAEAPNLLINQDGSMLKKPILPTVLQY